MAQVKAVTKEIIVNTVWNYLYDNLDNLDHCDCNCDLQ